MVSAPVFQVLFRVGDIPVAAQDDLAPRAGKLLKMRPELVHEGKLGRLPVLAAGTGGQVDRDDGKRTEVGFEITAFGVDVGYAQALDDAVRRATCVEPHTAVALLLGTVEVAVKSRWVKHICRHVGNLGLKFLQADDVGALAGEPRIKPLAGRRADAVEIESYNAHDFRRMRQVAAFKAAFLNFAIERQVLLFGEFQTKAGRLSPYFFNAGLFNDGASLRRLGEFYAKAILDAGIAFDGLFGPAYKGIPLVASVAIALADLGRNVPFSFNRKEAKDHGEGGSIVGAPLSGRILIIDDVISAGTSVRESVELIRAAGAKPCGVAIALDRQERGTGALSAVQEVRRDFGLPVISIANLDDLIAYLAHRTEFSAQLAAIQAYRQRYGVA